MPDISIGFDLPNAFGLRAADFSFDIDGYRIALAFLGDLATGSDHDEALTSNGGDKGMLIGWQRSDKFRRVYDKCKRAGDAEREALSHRVSPSAATGDTEEGNPPTQHFIPLKDLPARRSIFGWGLGEP